MINKKLKVGNVPNLRFPSFFGEWEVKKLGEVCEIKTGNKDTQNKVENGKYPFFVRSNTVEKIDSYSYDGEAILTSGDGVGVGKNFHYINGKFDFHQRVYALRNFRDGYSGKYIYHLFSEKFYDRVRKLSAKNSVDSVRMDMISQMKVYFPLLLEQQKISSFLSLIDERIQTQNKIIEQIEFYFKGIKDNLFSQKIRFGDFADDWKTKKLGDVLLKNSTKNKNQKHSTVQSVSNKYGFINQEDIFEDRRVASVDTSNYYVIDKGCFAYNPSRINVGSLAYKFDDKISIISPLYISFKAENIFLIDTFLLYWFKTIEFTKQMNNSFEGSVRNTLSYENLIKMSISIPSLKEQSQISSFLSKIDQKIQIEKAILEQLEMQKKYLLQQMFV